MPNRINFEQKPSKDYINFLLEEAKSKEKNTWFEKFCGFAELLGVEPPSDLKDKLNKTIAFSSLNVTAKGVFSASILTLFIFLAISGVLAFALNNTGLLIFLSIIPILAAIYVYTYPSFAARVQKVQTGDESIKIILYMIIYLKLNPTFEGAVLYASAHTKGPISNDIKKAVWDMQTGKYKSIEEALSFYIPKWVVWNEDFVRSLSLLYGVLIEPTEKGRDDILKKALDYMLENTKEKMKVYVEDISGSITIVHIMGILLPVMAMVMLPLVSMFLNDMVNPLYVGIGYTIILPTILYFFIRRILLKRPSAFLIPDVSKHPDIPPPGKFSIKIGKSKLNVSAVLVSSILALIIMSFGIMHFVNLYADYAEASPQLREDIMKNEANINMENVLSTLSITLGFGTFFAAYFYLNSFQRIKIRDEIKNIEKEFQVGLFTLGNYLSEGYPIEKSIEKSIDEYEKLGMKQRPTYKFFQKLLNNIKNTGMTFKRAVFDKSVGLIIYFPSVLIEEVMNVIASASERSSTILGNVSKTIAVYIENLNTIELKIRELLEEVRSGIKIQSTFVIPLVCAIVAALGIFILNMFALISCELQKIEKGFGFSSVQLSTDFIGDLIGSFSNMMPMTVLQAIIGIYTVEIVIITSMLLNGIENGFDPVSRNYLIATTLIKALIIYSIVFVTSLFIFSSTLTSMQTAQNVFTCS
ncbi:MAG: hypothetical protein N3D75_03025 [Candidatus Aenigmarchaeota archaeon]|nr:hypothetical protein [Candidatus Aenigmarchaeota archaeon]